MKRKLNVETGRRHSPASLPPLRTTRTAATNSLATRFRRRVGWAPLAWLALLALALTVPVHEAGAQRAPIAITEDATFVTEDFAVLNGTVDLNGSLNAVAWFEWSGSASLIGPFTGGGDVSAVLGAAFGNPLSPGTTYYFRLMAYNEWGDSTGVEKSFTTPLGSGPPALVTLLATDVTSSSATLNCTVIPHGGAHVWFEWGTSTASYNNWTSSIDLGPGTSAVPFSVPLVGLTPNTTYHFRVFVGQGMLFSFYSGD